MFLLLAVFTIGRPQGEFEAGISGQTKEHVMLIKTLGVAQLIVLVNSCVGLGALWPT